MREILFRGKRTDNGEWVEGYVVKGNCTYILTAKNIHYMVVSVMGHASVEVLPVIPDTVGQYTGLKDKNGRRIFEGDIVRYIYEPGKRFWNANQLSVIRYGKTGFKFDGIKGTNKYALMCGCMSSIPFDQDAENIPEFEVIGNIHDNPELLKEE